MDDTPQAAARTARLNPFVFPSDTDLRFALLIVSVLGSSLFIYNVLSLNIQKKAISAPGACTQQHIVSISALQQCLAPFTRVQTAWEISGVVLVLAIATAIYWIFPAYMLWRRKLVPLSVEDAPEVVAYLTDLCSEVGITPAPRFVWNPLTLTSSALAFGHFGQYYVALTGGLVTIFSTDQAAFRAIVLHELAHLRNADVNKTYFAVAVWWAFVAVALAPFVVYELKQGGYAFTLLTFGLVLVLAVSVYLTRNAVLRARESYADVRASVWEGPSGALGRVLSALPYLRGGWPRVMRMHPDPDERYQVLQQTQRLFHLSLGVAFGVGFAIGISLPSVQSILTLLSILATGQISIPDVSIFGYVGTALIFALLIVGTAGLSIWRATFAALAQGQVPRGAGRMALCLGLGLILGSFLSLNGSSLAYFDAPGLAAGTILFILSLPWCMLLLMSLFFFFQWITATSSAWFEVVTTSRSPRPVYLLALTIASAIGTVGLVILLFIRDASSVVELGIFGGIASHLLDLLLTILEQPLLLLLLMSLWAFPLAAWFWRGRVAEVSGSSWVFLDTSPQRIPLPHQAPFRLLLALMIGLVGGLVFCVLFLIIRIVAHLSVPETLRSTDQFVWAFYLSNIALAVLLQAGIAGAVAGRVRRLGSLHGLFAAFIGGCVMTVGTLGLNLLFGGAATAGFIWQTFSHVVNAGALLALPIALGVSAIVGWLRKANDEEVKAYAQ